METDNLLKGKADREEEEDKCQCIWTKFYMA